MRVAFLLRMAGRDLRGARRGLAPLAASVTAGITALVAINSLSDNLHHSINETAQAVSRLASYLGLLAVGALCLGGVGVASAAVVFIRQRRQAIAVLRCLGATAGEVVAIYLIEVVLLGLVGSVVGALAGVGVQQLVPKLLSDQGSWLVPALSWPAIATGIGMGVWVTVAFALPPLLPIRLLPPLAALRRDYEPTGQDWWRWLPVLVLAATVVALAGIQVGNWWVGAAFVGSVLVALVPLWLASRVLVRLLRIRLPAHLPFAWRQGLANLHRPTNQTSTVVLAIGLGTFLVSTLFLVKHNMMHLLQGPRFNVIFTGVRSDQLAALERELQGADVSVLDRRPTATMQIRSIKGRPVDAPATEHAGWPLEPQYRLTFRDTLLPSERVIAGQWWKKAAAKTATRPSFSLISVESGFAHDLGVGVGDEIVWDVHGVPVTTQVASLRKVEEAAVQFMAVNIDDVPLERSRESVVVEPGALDRIPHTFALFARAEHWPEKLEFQSTLTARYANVSVANLGEVLDLLKHLLSRVIWAVQFTGSFVFAAGALVLVATLATSRFHRVREGALLRTLGATRGPVLRVAFTEYAALGGLAVVVGVVLSSAAAWAVVHHLIKTSFSLPIAALSALALSIMALTVLIGLMNSREVLSQSPLEVFRAE